MKKPNRGSDTGRYTMNNKVVNNELNRRILTMALLSATADEC